MEIQVCADSSVKKSEKLEGSIVEHLNKKLDKFSSQLTTVHVHLADSNAKKGGATDKQCLIEARIAGMEPSLSNHQSDSLWSAIAGATQRIERRIRKDLDKRKKRELL